MQIWTPEMCKERYETSYEHFGKLHPITVFHYDSGWLPTRLEILKEGYAHDQDYVLEAAEMLTYPGIEKILDRTTVFLLSDPSYDHFNGSAGANYKGNATMVLYGRTTPIPRYMTHYIFAHELGHIVQELLCPDGGEELKRYFELRGCSNDRSAKWIEDYKQLWAEDFRYLFSIDSANQDTWSMALPAPSIEVRDFMLSLREENLDESYGY